MLTMCSSYQSRLYLGRGLHCADYDYHSKVWNKTLFMNCQTASSCSILLILLVLHLYLLLLHAALYPHAYLQCKERNNVTVNSKT